MRSVLLVFALAFTLISGQNWTEVNTKVFALSHYCTISAIVNNKLVEKSMLGKFVDDPKFLDYSSCIAAELDPMDEDGKFEENNFVTLILDNWKTTMNKCVVDAKKETSREKEYFEFAKCLWKNLNETDNTFDN
ncbi:PREDICTED: uncharacterized protein LOC108563403 [Nicrophorus vespilloides]|uniref:Uncharacterized protein LOC108563403 n=1 Tax=Nicrophorus vespilloides TaxID=110193 RepID=A0ABM1MSK3_NICVS|nr:PREDICTED: uncharacterized protein LOC108563403 [Nicrophorus vespilloides]